MGIGAVIVSQVIFPNPARSRSTFEHSKNGGRVVQLVCEGCGEDEGTGPKVAIYSAPIGFYVLSQPTTVFVPSTRELYALATVRVVAAEITHGQCM